LSLVSFFGGKLAAAPFGTFATISANNRLMQRSKQQFYSITSSARSSSDVGIVTPKRLAK
jgi:hypothetical protein